MPLRIETVVSQLFSQNAYVVWRPGNAAALIFDPGFDPEAIIRMVRREGLSPVAIINTHGHSDHIAGNAAMLAEFPEIPLVIGRNEAHLLTDPSAKPERQIRPADRQSTATQLVDDGERVELAGILFLVREISRT